MARVKSDTVFRSELVSVRKGFFPGRKLIDTTQYSTSPQFITFEAARRGFQSGEEKDGHTTLEMIFKYRIQLGHFSKLLQRFSNKASSVR